MTISSNRSQIGMVCDRWTPAKIICLPKYISIVSYVCLFVWVFSSHSRIFHSHGDFTIAAEELQILTFARHSWRLSSEGYLACHTYPVKMVTPEDALTYFRAFSSGAVTTWFDDLRLSRLGFEHPTFRLRANALTHCATKLL